MNSGSSLAKYAPRDSSFTLAAPWRKVSHSEGLQFVATSMQSVNPIKLTHLKIRVNLGMSDAQTTFTHKIKSFFKALATYEHCEHLDLGYCQISDHTCREYLEPMLQQNKKLKTLKINDNAFTDVGCAMIFTSLIGGQVSSLSLSRNGLTAACMDSVASVVKLDKFKNLDFSFTEIGAEGIKILCGALQHVTVLSALNLEDTKIGDEGCTVLASLIANAGMSSVQELNIADNHIGRVGVEKLVANFIPGKNESVTSLDLSKNYFGDEGFQFVMDMMQRNEKLKALKLNRVGLTLPKFATFCERLLVRYNQEFGPYPELSNLEVGYNGLGNEFATLFAVLKHKECRIQSIGYDSNEVTDHGAKLLKEFFRSFSCKRKGEMVIADNDSDAIKLLKKENLESRNNFLKLTLKSNAITADGAEHLAAIVNDNSVFRELDIRKNNIGVRGAIFFKKAFRKLQCKQRAFDEVGRRFKLHIMPADVGVEGLNHLAIGIREYPENLKKLIKSKANAERHKYVRASSLQTLWDKVLVKRNQPIEAKEPTPVKGSKSSANYFEGLDKRIAVVDKMFKHHQGITGSRFNEFDTADVDKGFNRSIVLCGQNDEKEDEWEYIMIATYTACGILETDRNVLKWGGLWGSIKAGRGCVLGNTLYRYGILLRLQYACESEEYIKDLYLRRYSKSNYELTMRKMDSLNINQIIAKLTADDIKDFWETLIPQTSASSEGLTMFEYVLKYAQSPVIDCIRQFLNVFPSLAYSRKGSKKSAVFLQQSIAQSGQTYRDLCLSSTDRFVRRYAESKKLVLFRFLEVEPIYLSKYVRLSKVEDLLLTEEYDDSERFFIMRKIAATSEQSDEKLAQNEFDTHKSFMDNKFEYVSGALTTYDEVDNLILKNVNMSLDAEFIPQVSQLHNRPQLLSDDSLVPTFTNIYTTNLREVLENESLAGGRDLVRAQIMLKMIANSLDHFNNRAWTSAISNGTELVKQTRCHGNVKPRNIVLRCDDELPNLDDNVGFLPGKWVLSDFSRSTAHGSDYFPIKDSAYNPPEVAKRMMSCGENHFEKRIQGNEKIDAWQFGCILFEVLSGTTLFKMEGNNDLIVDQRERGELINWLCLDEERGSLILNQLRANTGGFKTNGVSISLNNWCGYDEEEVEKIIASGRQLVEHCLQGRPEDRPTFAEILAHPFLNHVDVGRKNNEKDAENLVPVPESGWDTEKFLRSQSHLHIINTEFEQAGLVVRSLEEVLGRVGCRVTTDSVSDSTSPEKYEKELRENVESARVIACLLTRDAFYKPNVVKQLLFAEDYRKKGEKVHGRVLFLDLSAGLDLSKDNLTWSKEEFRNQWAMSDEFQYLVKALALENPSLTSFGVGQINYDDQFDSWSAFLTSQFRALVLSYLQEPIKYQPDSFLREPMVDRMLTDGHLVPTSNISKYSIAEPTARNFKDPTDLIHKKMEARKDKFLNLYFLPAHRVKKGKIRVYVLCASGGGDETSQAVGQIAAALETPSSINSVDAANKHKEATDPRNRLLNKVKTSYNLKKDSHLKVGGRVTALQDAKDKMMNIAREEGALLIVFYCTLGVFRRYRAFLAEAAEKRGSDGLSILLVKGQGLKVSSKEWKQEIKSFVPESLQSMFLNKDNYVPYFKPKKDPWQFEASMEKLTSEAIHKVEHPAPKENFGEIEMIA